MQNLTAHEYQERIYDIFDYMREDMGITCDPCDAMFKRLELNATFKVKDEFHLYEDCLHLIYGNLPSGFRDKKYDGGVSYATWYRANPEIQKKYLETALAKNIDHWTSSPSFGLMTYAATANIIINRKKRFTDLSPPSPIELSI